jgi:LysM repeat protein
MSTSFERRVGAIVAIVLVLSFMLIPAASASGEASPAAQPAAAGRIHIVRPGETLMGIARLYGVDVYELARVNHIYNLNRIYVGQRLVIPDGAPPPPLYYTVRPGDTLTKIAARFGTTVWALVQLNHISNPNRIYVGQVLLIRGTLPPPPPPPPPPPGAWAAPDYNNRDLTGTPALERRDADVNFNWGYSSPAPAVTADNFSARWTRTFYMSGGTYRITARVDDGVRVYIDGVQVIVDAWKVQAVTSYTQDVVLTTGNHTFTVEYFEAEGVAEVHLTSQKL